MSGCEAIRSVTSWANASRSTASDEPAGTAVRAAQSRSSEPRPRNSAFSSPGALCGRSEPSELLHTSSASQGVSWAGVGVLGRIS